MGSFRLLNTERSWSNIGSGFQIVKRFFQLLTLTTEAALAPIQSPIKTSASTPAGRRATMVQTWNWDLEDQKPELVIFNCADGGSMSK